MTLRWGLFFKNEHLKHIGAYGLLLFWVLKIFHSHYLIKSIPETGNNYCTKKTYEF